MNRKPNTESTMGERLCLVVGGILSVLGIGIVTIVGAFSSYSDTTTWIVGIALFVGGLLLANSMKLVEAIAGMVRW